MKAVITAVAPAVEAKMEQLRVADAISEIFTIFKRCNKYIDETAPWVLAKDPEKQDRLATVLYNLVEGITIGASLLEPFMPETTGKILAQLNTTVRDYEVLDQFGLYPSGNKVTEKPEILFARMDLKEVLEKVEVLQAAQAAAAGEGAGADAAKAENADNAKKGADGDNAADSAEQAEIHVELKDEITYDDFAKCQFVVGEVVACEEVPKSKKLLLFQVKIGDQTRQIVSGIKKWYKPEDVIGKKVMVLLNLKPAKLAGLMSEGMLLSAEDADGNVCLMAPSKDMPAGSGIS